MTRVRKLLGTFNAVRVRRWRRSAAVIFRSISKLYKVIGGDDEARDGGDQREKDENATPYGTTADELHTAKMAVEHASAVRFRTTVQRVRPIHPYDGQANAGD